MVCQPKVFAGTRLERGGADRSPLICLAICLPETGVSGRQLTMRVVINQKLRTSFILHCYRAMHAESVMHVRRQFASSRREYRTCSLVPWLIPHLGISLGTRLRARARALT